MKQMVGLVTWVLVSLSGCGTHDTVLPSPAGLPIEVKIQSIESSRMSTGVYYSGTVKARRQAILSTKLAGRISFLEVEEGDVVQAGALVAQIDISDLLARTEQARAGRDSALAGLEQTEAGYRQAEQGVSQARAQLKTLTKQRGEAQARLDLAKKDFDRYRTLAREGAVPRREAERAASELKVAQSRMDQLSSQLAAAKVSIRQSEVGVSQAQSNIARSKAGISEAEAGITVSTSDLEYGQIKAPFRGVVVEKTAYQGELSTPGRPLVKIQDLDSLEVSLLLPESVLEQVQPGTLLSASVPALGRELQLKVRQVIAATDPVSRTFEARLSLLTPTSGLFPGGFVRVSVPQEARQALLLPLQAVVTRGQLEGTFVVDNQNLAEFRLLQLGPSQADGREVLSGLQAGEKVILEPSEGLRDGQKVSPR